jgi:3-oxoacyl-[acyl-carrier-protein] synthase II
MAQITGRQRKELKKRLLAWASDQEAVSNETITEQIDDLLEKVLHEHDAPPEAESLAFEQDDPEDDQRIVVTGMGLVTPFGIGTAPFWMGLKYGRSAIGPITRCDVHDMPCQIAGEVRTFDAYGFIERRAARRMSRSSQFAVVAAQLALNDARLVINEDNCYETGALIACTSSDFPATEQATHRLLQHGPRRVSPLFLPAALPTMPACQVAMHFGLHGYTSAISSAGAASAQAIGEAAEIIRRGDAAIMLAGGAEAPISPLCLAGFHAMRALSTRNDEPTRASRPFDAQRDGFVPAEGAGILVLERLTHARRRGVQIYAELAGHASTCDAHSVAAPDPTGYEAARAIRQALRRAHSAPQQVDYIKAHASGTLAGDVAETMAIKQVFGEYANSIPISAPKSMMGHLTGASGSVEAAAALLSLIHNIAPPTINQEYPDPRCDLDYVPNVARPALMQTVVANSFALGGINTALVFRRLEYDD